MSNNDYIAKATKPPDLRLNYSYYHYNVKYSIEELEQLKVFSFYPILKLYIKLNRLKDVTIVFKSEASRLSEFKCNFHWKTQYINIYHKLNTKGFLIVKILSYERL